jgi:phage FluMu protein Com
MRNPLGKYGTHLLTKVERRRYVYFTCPSQPTLELVSFDFPLLCPVCRRVNPIKPGGAETAHAGYSRARESSIIREDPR